MAGQLSSCFMPQRMPGASSQTPSEDGCSYDRDMNDQVLETASQRPTLCEKSPHSPVKGELTSRLKVKLQRRDEQWHVVKMRNIATTVPAAEKNNSLEERTANDLLTPGLETPDLVFTAKRIQPCSDREAAESVKPFSSEEEEINVTENLEIIFKKHEQQVQTAAQTSPSGVHNEGNRRTRKRKMRSPSFSKEKIALFAELIRDVINCVPSLRNVKKPSYETILEDLFSYCLVLEQRLKDLEILCQAPSI